MQKSKMEEWSVQQRTNINTECYWQRNKNGTSHAESNASRQNELICARAHQIESIDMWYHILNSSNDSHHPPQWYCACVVHSHCHRQWPLKSSWPIASSFCCSIFCLFEQRIFKTATLFYRNIDSSYAYFMGILMRTHFFRRGCHLHSLHTLSTIRWVAVARNCPYLVYVLSGEMYPNHLSKCNTVFWNPWIPCNWRIS